jgi:hypothetical protein
MKLCDYRCGQEAKYQFKNGKNCCSKNHASCPSYREKEKGRTTGDKNPMFGKKQSEKCKLINSKKNKGHLPWWEVRGVENPSTLPEVIEKIRREKIGKPSSQKGKKRGPTPEETKRKIREKLTGREKPLGFGEKVRQRMIDGGAVYAASFNKNPSKEELKFRQIVFQLLPRPIHNYPIYRVGKRSYNVDIADPSLGIILEFDGWYHFSSEERKEHDKTRQQELEEEGWKFLRYNIFHPFPTLERLKQDIQKLVNNY